VLFLGDLFHVWIGDRRYADDQIRRLEPVLAGLRSRGVPSVYIEGNRDFFVAAGDYAELFDRVATEHAFTVGETRYLAVHGDGLNDRDWRYLLWRRLSKNSLSRAAVALLPSRLAAAMMHRTERRLAKTNFRHRQSIPEEAIRAYAERRLAEGHDVLVLGHFHAPLRIAVGGGEARIYDAWFHRRQLEWIEP
jgi:UDP-2,3-diacylglucosamine pyrophosphatase LpxH